MAFSEQSENLVNELINAEYLNAVVNFGEKYNSLHEGYAVLLEEVEEAVEAIKSLIAFKKGIWYYLKKGIHNNGICFEQSVCFAENDVQHAIKELAQVGAVLMKIRNTLEKSDDADVSTKRKVCNPDCECIHKEFDKWTCWGQKNAPYVELGDECPYQDKVEE